jgi:hypothetical protein
MPRPQCVNDLPVQERNPDILFISLESPGKRTHSRFPKRAPREREVYLQGILHISQKPHLLGSPVKEPSPRPPPRSLLREMSHPQSPFIQLSKSPVDEPSSPIINTCLYFTHACARAFVRAPCSHVLRRANTHTHTHRVLLKQPACPPHWQLLRVKKLS